MEQNNNGPNEPLFSVNEYLAVRNAEDSYFLCICRRNVYKSTKSLSIRWLDNVKDSQGDYVISYLDKIDLACVLTKVELVKTGKSYELNYMEQYRVEGILKESLDAEKGLALRQQSRENIDAPNSQQDQVIIVEDIEDISMQVCSVQSTIQNYVTEDIAVEDSLSQHQIVRGQAIQNEIIQDIDLQSSLSQRRIVQELDIQEHTTGCEQSMGKRVMEKNNDTPNSRQDQGSLQVCGMQNAIQSEITEDIALEDSLSQHQIIQGQAIRTIENESIQDIQDQAIGDEYAIGNRVMEKGTSHISAPQYSSNESQLTDDEEPQIKKVRTIGIEWVVVQTFQDQKLAEEEMAKSTDFSFHYSHRTESSLKKYFRCNKNPRRWKQCAAKYQLDYSNNSTTILKSAQEHDNSKKGKMIDEKTKSEIKKLIEMRLKPKAIISNLRNNPEPR